jgi:AraC-like DNA-binding protein
MRGGAVEAQLGDRALLERYCYAPGPAGETPLHVHDTYQWCLSVDFPGVYVYRGATVPMPPGALSVLHPDEPHLSRDPHARSIAAHYLVAYFPVAIVSEVATEVAGRPVAEPFFAAPVIDDHQLRAAYATMHAAATGLERDDAQLRFLALATGRHAGLSTRAAQLRVPPRVVGTVKAYLQEHAAEPVALRQLAELVGMSPFHLHRAFSRAVGLPPHRYQIGLRIEAAKRLLAGGAGVARTAVSTGFADYSHLSRHFQSIVGVSPSRYRALSKNVQDR